MDKIDTAIENAKAFCNDIQLLQDEIGSNLGELILAMKGNE